MGQSTSFIVMKPLLNDNVSLPREKRLYCFRHFHLVVRHFFIDGLDIIKKCFG